MSSALSAATQDRKARLAQLKSLKRKQPDSDSTPAITTELPAPTGDAEPAAQSPRPADTDTDAAPAPAPTPSYLSGRNYDASTRSAKLGFETAPSSHASTLEKQAAALSATTTAAQAAADADAARDAPIDLFRLQPKKPNWDLKRDLERKLEVLHVRTENAIARLVRERIQGAREKSGVGAGAGTPTVANGNEGLDVRIEGAALVEATKEREREDEEDARREREIEADLLDAR